MAGKQHVATDNRLLGAMLPAERDRVAAIARYVGLEVKTVLFEPGEAVEAVYFPLDGVISLVTPLQDGSIVEVATIGNEGVVGVPLIADGTLAVRAICQVRGAGLLVPAAAFLAELARNPSLRDVYDRYVPALFGQIAQAAACNRLHTNEERLSRWLLMSRDRVGVDEFSITHEFLGQMLGSRRATVTLSAGILQAAGLIRYHRGRLTIVDREGLEEVACECYASIKAELDGALSAHLSSNGHSPNGHSSNGHSPNGHSSNGH
jgi:CRP-like cAMP-binding protein